jgi:hypothetical protein
MHDNINSQFPNDTTQWDQFFMRFSWAFLNFAAAHHLRVDKYWHDFPSWRFSFKHPKGGLACIEVFKEGENQVSVLAYWWLDDYEQGTRSSRKHESETFDVESMDMAGLLNESLNTLLSWQRDSWTEVTTGLGESWKKAFSKEQFTIQMEEYPVLSPYSV